MNDYALIIFDWDGTLMDSASRIIASLRGAAVDVDLPRPSVETARSIIGLNMQDCMMAMFGDIPDAKKQAYFRQYRHHFHHPDAHHMPMYAGVIEGLDKLDKQGKLLAVATGKGRRGLDPLLAEYGLEKYFAITRCADETFGKPHPQMVLEILEFTGLDKKHAVLVGDTTYDMEMAANAGVDAIAVEYGMHPPEKLAEHDPVATFGSFTALSQYLLDDK